MAVQIKGIKGGRDRSGLVSLTFSFFAQDVSFDDALTMALPSPTSLPETGRVIGEWEVDNNSFIINATHEGTLTEFSDDDGEFEISGEFSEEPIEAHPAIAAMIANYGGTVGDDGRVQFAQKLPGGTSGQAGLSRGKTTSDINPLFGLTSYPAMRLVASHRRPYRTLPARVWSSVGSVISNLPSGFSEPGGKQWMIMPPSVHRRGNAWDVTLRYKDISNDRGAAIIAKLVVR